MSYKIIETCIGCTACTKRCPTEAITGVRNQIHVIDPEDEYARLAAAVGGTYVHLGAEQVRLNPMDLPIHTRPDGRRTAPRDALIRRSLFLHTVISVLLGSDLEATERAALDRAITATYQRAGITSDPRTWTRPAPLLADLAEVLADAGDPAGAELAARLTASR